MPQDIHGGSDTKCPLTVKILDAVKGTPAGPIALTVYQKTAEGGWTRIAAGYVPQELGHLATRLKQVLVKMTLKDLETVFHSVFMWTAQEQPEECQIDLEDSSWL